ncbi:MAG: hypothetical protein ACYTBJ_25075 [Planctomycetota bacterium]
MGNPISTLKESDERIARQDNYANFVEVRKLRDDDRGRKTGRKTLSPMMRNLIGAAARIDGAKSASKAFDVSESSARHYSKGRTGQEQPIVKAEKAEVEKHVDNIRTKREKITNGSYDAIAALFDDDGPVSAENVKAMKPREAVSVAKDLAAVVDRITPKEKDTGQKVQVVVFAPRQKEEKDYESIDIDARVVE